MIFLGVGAVSGGFLNGWLLDVLGYKRAILVNAVEVALAFGVLIAFVWYGEFNLWFASAFCCLWGA
jgi:hypothetical protein